MTITETKNRGATAEETAHQYLTFILENDEYGIDLLGVQEIKGYSGITALPNTPAYVRGVMNLRGTVIPVVDLRMKFAMAEQEYTKFTVVIVVKVRDKTIGLVVDAVSDVLDIPESEVRETPELGTRSGGRFIKGIATIGQKLVVLLEIERLLTDEELTSSV